MTEAGQILVRSARNEDAAELELCFLRAYAPFLKTLPDLPPVTEGLAEEIAAHDVFVIEADGRLLGGLILYVSEEAARIANLAVDPEHAGQGYGRRLLATAEQQCLMLGRSEIELTTHAAMDDAQALYRHLGWNEVGRAGNRVFMRKVL